MNNSYIPKEGFGPKGEPQCDRLTKREQMAAMAMQGLLSSDVMIGALEHKFGTDSARGAAVTAIHMADALLKELEK